MRSVSLREQNRRWLRRMLQVIERRRCQIVLMMAETRGAIWMRVYDNKISIIHSEKTAIILRGKILNEWIEGNQVKSFSERTTSIKIGNLKGWLHDQAFTWNWTWNCVSQTFWYIFLVSPRLFASLPSSIFSFHHSLPSCLWRFSYFFGLLLCFLSRYLSLLLLLVSVVVVSSMVFLLSIHASISKLRYPSSSSCPTVQGLAISLVFFPQVSSAAWNRMSAMVLQFVPSSLISFSLSFSFLSVRRLNISRVFSSLSISHALVVSDAWSSPVSIFHFPSCSNSYWFMVREWFSSSVHIFTTSLCLCSCLTRKPSSSYQRPLEILNQVPLLLWAEKLFV